MKKKSHLVKGLILFIIVILVFLLPFFISNRADFSVGDSGSDNGIGVIPIYGVIYSSDKYLKQLKKFAENDNIKAIILRINSPGGAVGASQEVYDEIMKVKKKKPVISSFLDVAASGGFYIASASTEIITNPGTLTGSIGVIMEYLNFKDLVEWAKIKPEVIKSGKFKDTGSPYKDLSKEERKYLNRIVQNTYKQFLKAVYTARKDKGVNYKLLKKIADGRVFTGEEAVKYKLADKLGNFYVAVDEAKKLGKIKGEPKLIYPKKKRDFLGRIIDEGKAQLGITGHLNEGINILYLWR